MSVCGVDNCDEPVEEGSDITVQLPIAQVTVKLCHHHASRLAAETEEVDPREVQAQ